MSIDSIQIFLPGDREVSYYSLNLTSGGDSRLSGGLNLSRYGVDLVPLRVSPIKDTHQTYLYPSDDL